MFKRSCTPSAVEEEYASITRLHAFDADERDVGVSDADEYYVDSNLCDVGDEFGEYNERTAADDIEGDIFQVSLKVTTAYRSFV